MGRASSSKKVARAARTAGRPGESKKWTWPVAIGAVVLMGVALVFVSRPDNPEPIPPRLGDHWHAAYGINLCGEWLPPLQDQRPDDTGIHTHGDGLIHMHPFSTRSSGAGANLATFGDMVGLEIGDGTLTVPGGFTFADGEDCEGDLAGEEGIVQVMVWDDPSATEGRLIEDDPGSYAPQDGEVITIAFLPEGAEIEMPPTVPRLQDPLAAEEGRQPVPIDDPSVPPAPDDAIVDGTDEGADASPEDGEGGFVEDPGLEDGGEPTDP